MNSHLNLFRTYSKEDKEYQLEDDLTRAVAICLLDNTVFLHETLKYILSQKEHAYDNLFSDYQGKSEITIDIQKRVSDINDFDHLFAVSLTGCEMNTDEFFNQTNQTEYDPRPDMVINIDNCAIVFEVKPDDQNCISQLYNQAYNACDKKINVNTVTPVDLNWPKLMTIVLKVINFETAINKKSKSLNDLVELIQRHNFRWLPQASLSALNPADNKNQIIDRIKTALSNSDCEQLYKADRFGYTLDVEWASELLFTIGNNGDMTASIYPGNTKNQGWHLFPKTGEPQFKNTIKINNIDYKIDQSIHIKFTSFQRCFTGLWARKVDLTSNLMTAENFRNISGRKKRGERDWEDVSIFFDNHFNAAYSWRDECDWKNKVIKSNRNQFDLSFGYELSIIIPYQRLQEIDFDKDNINPLTMVLDDLKAQFESTLI